MICEVYLSDAEETWRPKNLPDGRQFRAKPETVNGIKFSKRSVLDTEKAKQWKWPDTDRKGGWAPWNAFSSYLPIFENTDMVLPWQWPLAGL